MALSDVATQVKGEAKRDRSRSRSRSISTTATPPSPVKPQLSEQFQEGLARIRCRANVRKSWNSEALIEHVVMIVVVQDEVRPVIDEFGLQQDASLTAELLGLAT